MGALMLLILIPLWQNVIIPLLLLTNIKIEPLQSVALGGFTAALSFVCAACLQLKIESNQLLMVQNQPSILWQMPQFFLIMMGEVLLSIPGLQFSFTQAPPSMKSVLTATWFCNNAFGNLIVVAITQWKPFKLQSNEYFLYASLMLSAVLIFIWIANNYRYMQYEYNIAGTNRMELEGNDNKSQDNDLYSRDLDINYYNSQDGLEIIL